MLCQIYITMRPFESFPIFLFLLVLAQVLATIGCKSVCERVWQMPKFLYSTKFGTLICSDKKVLL